MAENSGGVHCLKYGLTANNVLGIEMVLMNGEVVRLGGKHLDCEGYDLLGVMTGSEGLLGVVTEVTVRILQKPETARALLIGFPTSEQGGQCVADIIGAGIIPGGMEMMDRPAIHAAEDFVHAGYPLECRGAADRRTRRSRRRSRSPDRPGRDDRPQERRDDLPRVDIAKQERLAFWAAARRPFRRSAASRRTITAWTARSRARNCRKVLAGMRELSETIWPARRQCVSCRRRQSASADPLRRQLARRTGARPKNFGADILRLCVKVGGVLTGEHGVGVEKRELMPEMFNETDLDQQMRVKCAFDPNHLLNPGKVFPQLRRCAELGRMHVHRGQVPFPDIPRF